MSDCNKIKKDKEEKKREKETRRVEKEKRANEIKTRYLLLPLMELISAHSQCTKGNFTNRYD